MANADGNATLLGRGNGTERAVPRYVGDATLGGCTCRAAWSPGPTTCADGRRVYSGCGMEIPCVRRRRRRRRPAPAPRVIGT